MSSYKDLKVWQTSMDLVVDIYDITSRLPKDEKYGLISQMRRSSVSIPSNIAEGNRRKTEKDQRHFYRIAYASGAELETQIEIVKRITLAMNFDFTKTDALLLEIMKMLNVMVK